MSNPLSMTARIIVLAKKYRRWVFGLSARKLLGLLGLEFLALVISALTQANHAVLDILIKLFAVSFLLMIATYSVSLICDALIEFTQKNRALAASSGLLTMGLTGLFFSAWQIILALSRPINLSGH